MKKNKRLYIIDGAGYYFRAFFGIRRLTSPTGTPTNAVYGFATMIGKILRDENPDYIAIALDSPEKTHRHDIYPDYKANRSEMPEELAVQLPLINRLIESARIPQFRIPGQEADDIIGTIALKAKKTGLDVTIVSSDKDFMQLIGPQIRMLDTMKDKSIGPDQVVEKFGVEPARVTDILGLMGDSSDNIPGVPGVGEKTAMQLVADYGDIESIIRNADKIKKPKLRENIAKFADQARLSKKLATIETGLDINLDFATLARPEPDTESLRALYGELGFKSLIEQLGRPGEPSATRPESRPIEPSSAPVETPPAKPAPAAKKDYRTILTIAELDALAKKIAAAKKIAVDTETTSVEPVRALLVGISLAVEPDEGFYIPVGHRYIGAPEQLPLKTVLEKIGPMLTEPGKLIVAQNAKYDLIVLKRHGLDLGAVAFDTMLASYVLDPARGKNSLTDLAIEHLDYRMTEYSEVAGKGKGEIPFAEVSVEAATAYSAEDADVTLKLEKILEPKLGRESLGELYREIELPLVPVLARMEIAGIKVDTAKLGKISRELADSMGLIETDIYKLAGGVVNINSPKQLAALLFDKIGLKPAKKTKTGYSVDQSVLEELAAEHELPAKILEYRSLSKLKSTYTDALPTLINPETGRIHTSFNQTITATGRLSSSNPNLQNIPVRTDAGKNIRSAFVAEPGNEFVSADYSQIELRVLAHLSGDPLLIESFNSGEDVHARTASALFNVEPAMVDADMRRVAKTVNFGVIYGLSAFRLARELKLSRKEAQEFIDSHFAKHTAVREYIDSTVDFCKQQGYVATHFGRRRYIPEINSGNRQVRDAAARTAVNTPIQGTAADIIKIAMIRIDAEIARQKLEARMILQVHDELVFEAPRPELPKLTKIIRHEMESAVKFDVPMTTDIGHGPNWHSAH